MTFHSALRSGVPAKSVPEQLLYNATSQTLILLCKRRHMGEVYVRPIGRKLYERIRPTGKGVGISIDTVVSAISAPTAFCHVVRKERFEKGFLAHHQGIYSINLRERGESRYVAAAFEESMALTRILGVSADGQTLYCTMRLRRPAATRTPAGEHALVTVQVSSGAPTVVEKLHEVFF